ncbi:MAG: YncE family protein [Phycisphaerales bacterium]|nr:YncE family protein [Phycisphaerales bacterium]
MARWLTVPVLIATAGADAQFTNYETPHVTPMSISPDGTTLFVVNTADNRVEIFDIAQGWPSRRASVPVGLDPVSVRAPDNSTVWVANHLSDSVSIISRATNNVFKSLAVGDEPTDIVFANNRAFVSVSQLNQVKVYDLSNLNTAPTVLTIEGEDPRAMVVGAGGTRVYVAIFESGNETTAIDELVVNQLTGPYGGVNPPPNDNGLFSPPLNPGNPAPPQVGMILKYDRNLSQWTDDNGIAWPNSLVPWRVHDHDVAVIDTATLGVTYMSHTMNLNMALTVRPDGQVAVVGTDAINQVRFEPNLTAHFVHSVMAFVDPALPAAPGVFDLNPHLADEYQNGVTNVSQAERDLSIADPRGIVWVSDGSRGYVTGMGSNNVAVVDAAGARLGQFDVGQGPTGIVIDEARDRLYVMNKFDGTISTIALSSNSELRRDALYDPTPAEIKDGRPVLYDARHFSGLGVTSCAACHVDARLDQLAWDLGNPAGDMKSFNQNCQAGGPCEDWHPMKGPMTTQTFQGLVGGNPLHWRADRENLAAFAGAFVSLLGMQNEPSAADMTRFEGFLNTIHFPPNPLRNIDNSFRTSVLGGNAVLGNQLFNTAFLFANTKTCVECHTLPLTTSPDVISTAVFLQTQSFNVGTLQNAYEKTGFSKASSNNNRGFGFSHDGTIDSIDAFLRQPMFTFSPGTTGDTERLDMNAYVMSISRDQHAGVGSLLTLDGTNNNDSSVASTLNVMRSQANLNRVGFVVKGVQAGVARGYQYIGSNTFRSDRNGETISFDALKAAASAGNELTWMMVAIGSQARIGIDRDLDGFFDRDELDGCGDPANPLVGPGGRIRGDSNYDGRIDNFDIEAFVTALIDPAGYSLAYPTASYLCNNDMNIDGVVDNFDIDPFIGALIGG